jgi:putative glutamine amidotransferase
VSRPVIGLTTYREEAAWGVWQQRADLLHTEYADTVVAAGGVPILLPPATEDRAAAAAVIARVDGLIVSGGADVDPARYDAEPHDRTAGWRPDRDAWELALLDAAGAADLPALGVCRGMQVMAVHAGGALDQHTPDIVGHEQHSPGGEEFGDIRVSTEPGSRLASLVGPEVKVACHHHQSVREAPGFRFTARAEDGTAEAMEATDGRFRIGVQWHPEMRTELALFLGIVQAAAG